MAQPLPGQFLGSQPGQPWELSGLFPTRLLTSHNQLPLSANGGSSIAGNAGVVAIVLQGDAGDLQGAHELLALNGDARA